MSDYTITVLNKLREDFGYSNIKLVCDDYHTALGRIPLVYYNKVSEEYVFVLAKDYLTCSSSQKELMNHLDNDFIIRMVQWYFVKNKFEKIPQWSIDVAIVKRRKDIKIPPICESYKEYCICYYIKHRKSLYCRHIRNILDSKQYYELKKGER